MEEIGAPPHQKGAGTPLPIQKLVGFKNRFCGLQLRRMAAGAEIGREVEGGKVLTNPLSQTPPQDSAAPLVSSWEPSVHTGPPWHPSPSPLVAQALQVGLFATQHPVSCCFRAPRAAWKTMRFSWAPRPGPAPPKRIPSATAAWTSFTSCWRRWAGEACRVWRLEKPALPPPPPPPPLHG